MCIFLPIFFVGWVCKLDIPPCSQVFPSYVRREDEVTKQSALAKLKEKWVLKQVQNMGVVMNMTWST